ncbi:MMPL family transporter, partial [Rhodococcus aerolatus]
MFASWGALVHRRRWVVLVVVLVAALGSGAWGLGLFDRLTQGGFADPASASAQADDLVRETFGRTSADVIAVYTAPAGTTVDDPALAAAVGDRLAALPADDVASATSFWATGAPTLVNADRTRALAVVTLRGDTDAAVLQAYERVADDFTVDAQVPGATVALAGFGPQSTELNQRTEADLVRAETVSLPVVLVLLVLVFGGLVAASLPVVVGLLTILFSLGVLRLVSLAVDVNSFSVNVVTLLGLGLAIDYGLFTVSRFREELQGGATTAHAVQRTVATAGRTVAFSATLLAVALSGLLLFPQGFLKSLGYGGMAAVAMAAMVALTVLPATLAVLGPRVDAARVPRAGLRPHAVPEVSFWGRTAGAVMRRPLLVAVPITAVLVLLALPFGGARFGDAQERALPPASQTRLTTELLRAEFPSLVADSATLVVTGGTPAELAALGAAAQGVAGVSAVAPTQQGTAPDGTAVTVLTATLDATGATPQEAVRSLRDLPAPAGAGVLVGGSVASTMDSLDAVGSTLPAMALLLVVATLVLVFLAFGSVLLPIKAVVMSALSLGATFGLLTWVFVDGHGAGVLGITPGPLEAGVVVMMVSVIFGLSTDYETFLLSRMVEARAAGVDTQRAIRRGTGQTGGVISAAAVLLAVVAGAFAFSDVVQMRFIGLGMIVALVLDATVVRMLLVPTVMAAIGDRIWWAPAWLVRVQQAVGLGEVEAPATAPAAPAAAPRRRPTPRPRVEVPGLEETQPFPALPDPPARPEPATPRGGPAPRPDYFPRPTPAPARPPWRGEPAAPP